MVSLKFFSDPGVNSASNRNEYQVYFLGVLPSTLDTPLPTFFPVLERVLERVLRDGAKVPCRIFFYLLYRLKSATFYNNNNNNILLTAIG
jgi:hypothetical protein